jgi:hypothetical protein
MAFTVTLNKKTVFGDTRVHMYDITADAATAEIDTGFDFIDQVHANIKSANSFGPYWARNVLSAATASNGTLSVTGCTSGDSFFVTVYGR